MRFFYRSRDRPRAIFSAHTRMHEHPKQHFLHFER